MGRFKAETIKVRQVDGLTIVFKDARAIYLGYDDIWVVFHRWGAPRGSYSGGWQQFRHLLYYSKSMTSVHCFELADRFNIPFVSSRRAPRLRRKEVEYV